MFGLHMGRMGGTGRVGSAPIWTPAANFASGEPGLWYDPSTFTGLYQDSAGSSPATAVGQPVGKMLDKSGRNNHISQATASARPLIGARVNLLTKTEDFAAFGFSGAGGTKTINFGVAPDGTTTAARVQYNGASAEFNQAVAVGSVGVASCYIKGVAGETIGLISNGADAAPLITLTGAWQSVASLTNTSNAATWSLHTYGGATARDVQVWHPQLNRGVSASTYQRVNTASDYDTVGFPQFDSFDGLDDGMSKGAITLGSDMDCFIVVKRTSATGILLYTTAGSGVYLGALDATAGAASAGAGTPTYAVNGVDVAGGTGTTRTQLAAAIPIGSWVVLEIRNANLSAWAALAMGAYTGFPMGMDFAQGIVCPAGDATTRTKNRQFAGAKVGLSL